MSLRFQRAIIVGASSGIGEHIARQLAASGTDVAIVGHLADELERVAASIRSAGKAKVVTAVHDVTHYDATPAVFEKLIAELGGVDLVLYAAGILWMPEESEYDFSRDRAQMEVNTLGAMAWTNLAAARFEAQRSGSIVAISSIAGERGRRTMPGYTTSKGALTVWMEALRNRVSRYGVNVVTVKPGMVRTAMTANLARTPMIIPVERAASLIIAAARKGGSNSTFIPFRWNIVALVLRHIPSFVFRKLNL